MPSKWHQQTCRVELVQIPALGNLIDPALIGFNRFDRKFPLLYDRPFARVMRWTRFHIKLSLI